MSIQIKIRNVVPADLEPIVALDQVTPPEERKSYWDRIFGRYGGKGSHQFLVAEREGEIVGVILGEVRAWEFGSPPCGWVIVLAVSPASREQSVGRLLFEEVCSRLKQEGVTTVRTMVERDNKLTLSFFRSQGMRTGKYIELERELD